MRLDSRKEDILGFIVRDFVGTALPVSSGRISEKSHRKRGITGSLAGSPATIRNIMLELDEDGYLYQPHTSAGRTPTEKGYRYFVDNLMEIGEPDSSVKQELDGVIEGLENSAEDVFDELSGVLASHLKLFSGIGFLDEDEKVFARGLPTVLREPEFEERDLAAEFADFVENAESNLRSMDNDFENEDFQQLVGIKKFGSVSVAFNDEAFGRCVIFSFGPKRMNYERATSTLKYTAKDMKGKSRGKFKLKKHK